MAGYPSELTELLRRVEVLERQLEELRQDVRTHRLVVVDDLGRERVVVAVDDEVAELRVRLPRSPGGSTEAVLFAALGRGGLPAGIGLQLWRDGDLVGGLERWAD